MLGVDPTFMLLQFKHLNKKLQNSDGFNLTECLQAWENMYVCRGLSKSMASMQRALFSYLTW